MITEDYVNFECSKLLKEKWFDIECQCCYTPKGYKRNLLTDANNTNIQDFNSLTEFEYEGVGLKGWYGSISAPTLQMAMKWLREVHKVEIRVSYDKEKTSWWGECIPMYEEDEENSNMFQSLLSFDYPGKTYEEACEAAIKYCLTNLI